MLTAFDKTSQIEEVTLSDREKNVLVLASHGYTSEQIAIMLHISQRTVTSIRNSLMEKTRSKNVAGLVRFAYRQGYIS